MDITPIVLALLMPLTIITLTDLGIRITLDLPTLTVWYIIIRTERITCPLATAMQFTTIIIEIEVETIIPMRMVEEILIALVDITTIKVDGMKKIKIISHLEEGLL
jgi:hypothetical protein